MDDKCYAVVDGDYSDYQVLCVFEREEDAVEYIRRRGLKPYQDRRSGEWRTKYENGERVERFDYYSAGVVPALTRG